MLIIATFEHSVLLEVAIMDMETNGIPKKNILAAPLTIKPPPSLLLDSMHHTDGKSKVDGGFLGAVFASVIFTIYGSIWPGGPLLWGLVGLTLGGAMGLLLDNFHPNKNQAKKQQPNQVEVVLLVNCEEHQAAFVERTLYTHHALGVSKVP